MFPKRALVAIVSASMVSLSFTGFAASSNAAPAVTASSSSFVVNGPREVKQGDKVVYTAEVGKAHKNRKAVLEEVSGRLRIPLAVGRVKADGTVSFKTTLPVAGKNEVRVRVLKANSTAAVSAALPVSVSARQLTAAQKKEQQAELALAQGALASKTAGASSKASAKPAKGKKIKRQGISIDLEKRSSSTSTQTWGPENFTNSVVTPAQAPTRKSAHVQSQEAVETTHDAAKSIEEEAAGFVLGDALFDGLVDYGVGFLLDLLQPNDAAETDQLIDELSEQIAEDFAVTQQELNELQEGLSTVSAQITQVSGQVSQANASAAASACLTVLAEADGYTNQIRTVMNNYQATLNADWLTKYALPQTDLDGRIRVLGNQTFGSSGSSPSFLAGVTATQLASQNLASLLEQRVVPACGSAVSAQIAAQWPAFTNNGYTPIVGAVDDAYFQTLSTIVNYYASWAYSGHMLYSYGAILTLNTLDPTPPTTSAALGSPCAPANATWGTSSRLCQSISSTLSGIDTAVEGAIDAVGASWGDVTGGVLGTDTIVNGTNNYMIPAQSALVLDVGAANLTNNYEANNWVNPYYGLSLGPANSQQWNNVLQLINQPAYPGATASVEALCGGNTTTASGTIMYSCTAAQSMGQMISAAGLTYNGAPVNQLIYTGERSLWNATKSGIEYTLTVQNAKAPIVGRVNQQIQSWSASYPNTWPVRSFIDPALTGNNGFSAVVQDPALGYNTLTLSDLYPWTVGNSITAITNNQQFFSSYGAFFGSCSWNYNNNSYQPYVNAMDTGATRLWPQYIGLPTGTQLSTIATYDGMVCGGGPTTTGQINLTQDPNVYGQGSTLRTSGQGQAYCTSSSEGSQPCSSGGPSNIAIYPPGASDANPNGPYTSPLFTNTFAAAASQGIAWPSIWIASGQPGQLASACPAGPLGGATSFSQGLGGNSGVTNMCNNEWSAYKALTYGQSSGNLDLFAPDQSTRQPTGGYQADFRITNSSSSTTSAIVYLGNPAGINLPGTLMSSTPGSSVTSCNAGGFNGLADTYCIVQLAPGESDFTTAVSFTSGSSTGQFNVVVTDTNGTNLIGAAGGTVQVNNQMVDSGSVPDAPTNFTAAPSTGGTNEAVLAWTAPNANPVVNSYTLGITDPNGNQSTQTISAGALTVVGNNDGQTGVTNNAGGVSVISYGGGGSYNSSTCTGGGCNPWTATVNSSTGAVTFTSTVRDLTSTQYLLVNGVRVYTAPQTTTGASWSTTLTFAQMGGAGTHNIQTTSAGWDTFGTITITATAATATAAANSDMQVTTNVTLPSSSNGTWRFTLAASNASGTSATAQASTFLGQGPPSAVQNLSAVERGNGTISIAWNPVTATPTVSSYVVSWQGPDGQWSSPAAITGTQLVLPQQTTTGNIQPLSAGTYAVSVQAQNSLGTGPATTTQVNVIGAAPSAVGNISANISATGAISAFWSGADAVPSPSKYSLAIYGPDASGTAIFTQDFPIAGVNKTVTVPNFFRIGNNSKPGMYTVVVSGTNAVGIGEAAMAGLYISQDTINESTLNRVNQQILGSMPASFQALAAAQCQAGLWQSAYSVFGSCNTTTNVFTSAPGLPPLYSPPATPTAPAVS